MLYKKIYDHDVEVKAEGMRQFWVDTPKGKPYEPTLFWEARMGGTFKAYILKKVYDGRNRDLKRNFGSFHLTMLPSRFKSYQQLTKGLYKEKAFYLSNFSIEENKRGQGFGTWAIKEIIRQIRWEKAGYECIIADCYEERKHFYERLGFRCVKTDTYFGHTTYTMVYDL